MVDLACLFAARPGLEPTLVLTPANAALVRPTLDRSAAAGRPVGLLLFPFPSVGLPDGVENLATAPASESWRVYKAVDLAQTAHDEILHIQERQVVAVPDLPGRPIEITRAELPEFLLEHNHMSDTWDRMKEAQLTCHGVVANTFYGFEPEYCDDYRRVDARQAWFVGPVALASCGGVERGGGTAAKEDGDRCMAWLDTREEGSVLFVCFGSWCHFTAAQLREMAAGLEASGQPFLWAVRKDGDGSEEESNWIPEGWEDRVAGRGLVVRGFAPQVAILGHRAVRAFLSHCGWNSVLEAVTAGKPMLTPALIPLIQLTCWFH
ncbi:unnamed protein product [Musa acuminata subsp. malaccensis]|uniref:(wild Malaysian banana) hypothetical protein n=1 Tax=Musa acuminata subsp. malaccensis TaxID=214687 RepID=A0A804K0E1_MUSAM|nr:unnamed protein product [Musa acuminata subsp. malaccensis]